MTWISKTVTTAGLVLLAHACYSAQEHSALQSLLKTTTTLPTDIGIETVLATIIICLGLVLGTPPLRPIAWRVWAGKIEREGPQGFLGPGGVDVSRDYVGNPFKVLESRPGFMDIRRQRRDFADWVRVGGGEEVKEEATVG